MKNEKDLEDEFPELKDIPEQDFDEDEYPDSWRSHSSKDALSLAVDIQKKLSNNGCETEILDNISPAIEGDFSLHPTLADFSIHLINRPWGCDVKVDIYEASLYTFYFLDVWKDLVKEEIVWGGRYKLATPKDDPEAGEKAEGKEAIAYTGPFELLMSWENIPDDIDVSLNRTLAKKLAFLWCTTGYDIKQIANDKEFQKGVRTLYNVVWKLRRVMGERYIPLKKDRKRYCDDFHEHLDKASEAEKATYEKMYFKCKDIITRIDAGLTPGEVLMK